MRKPDEKAFNSQLKNVKRKNAVPLVVLQKNCTAHVRLTVKRNSEWFIFVFLFFCLHSRCWCGFIFIFIFLYVEKLLNLNDNDCLYLFSLLKLTLKSFTYVVNWIHSQKQHTHASHSLSHPNWLACLHFYGECIPFTYKTFKIYFLYHWKLFPMWISIRMVILFSWHTILLKYQKKKWIKIGKNGQFTLEQKKRKFSARIWINVI